MADPIEEEIRAHMGDGSGFTFSDAPKGPKRFKREMFADIQPSPTEWLIKHFLPALGVAILYGTSTVGKSFFALYICLRVAMGNDVLGHKTKRAGVLYFAAEDQNGMRKRIAGLREKWGISAPAFQYIGDTLNLLDEDHVEGMCIAAEEAAADMEALGLKMGLIVIDTTAASMAGGNENASEDMGRVLIAGQRIGLRGHSAVMFVSHPGKDTSRGVRGWSGQTGNVDAIYHIEAAGPELPEKELSIGVVEKLKNGQGGERFAYRLKTIHCGVDEDGDAITTAYPSFEDPPSKSDKPGPRKTPVEQKAGPRVILKALERMVDDPKQSCDAPPVSGVSAGMRAVDKTALFERAKNIGYGDDRDNDKSVRSSFNRDIRDLVAGNKVRQEGELIWPI